MADIVSNFQQGLAFGQNQRSQRQAAQEKEQIRNLAPAIMQGDPEAYTQAAVVNPEAAQTYQEAGDRGYRRLTNVIGIMQKAIDSNNPVAKQTAFRTITPYLKQLTGGGPVPEQWDDSLLPGFEQLKQRVSMAEQGGTSGTPTGFRQFQMTAEAAGLTPGTPEYQQAARIALGQEGRASSAGYGFREVTGGDGRTRLARNNPRTGAVEVYDESTGNFMPVGGSPMPLSAGADGTPVRIDPSLPPEVQQAILANPQNPNFNMAGANPSLLVGRSPEAQAAATTSAQEAARLQYLPAELGYKTQAAINEAQSVGAIKGQQEVANKTAEQRAEKERSADSVLNLTREASTILPSAGGGRLDQLVNTGANLAGISTEQSRANRQLKVIAGQLTAAQPKMSGPQSDKDVQLYREMAGDVANEALPIEDRQAAIQVIERLQKKYAAPKTSGRTVVRRGTLNGRPVVQYSDGTTDYAD